MLFCHAVSTARLSTLEVRVASKQTFHGNMLLHTQMFKELLLLATCFRASTRIVWDEDTITSSCS